MQRLRPAACLLALVAVSCTPQGDPGIGPEGFRDDFERTELGPDYNRTGGSWRISEGALQIRGARNHPLWLRRTLPPNVRIEFDATSHSPAGDIKVEIYGDGVSHARSASYTATSYVVILGGWNNTVNAIARMNEHGDDRVVGPRRRIEQDRTYHVAIERRGGTLVVELDGQELMRMEDDAPLSGRGHDHFAFNDWDAELTFDNLVITPL